MRRLRLLPYVRVRTIRDIGDTRYVGPWVTKRVKI